MRLIVAGLLLFLLPGFTSAFWTLGIALIQVHTVFLPLLVGLVLGFVVDQMFLRRLSRFETFEHELTHALVARLFLRRVTGFKVTNGGGSVCHQGRFGGQLGDDFIGLAPYVLPTFTVISVLVRAVLNSAWFPWFDVWVGATLGFHAWSTIRETKLSWSSRPFRLAGSGEWVQSDTAQRGFVFSFVYIVSLTVAVHGLVLGLLISGYRGFRVWGSLVWPQVVATAAFVVTILKFLVATIV